MHAYDILDPKVYINGHIEPLNTSSYRLVLKYETRLIQILGSEKQ